MSTLRPLTMAELVDRAAVLWRAEVWTLARLFLGFQVAQYLLLFAAEQLTASFAPVLKDPQALPALLVDPERSLPVLGTVLAINTPLFLLATVISQLCLVAGSRYLYPLAVGLPATPPSEALAHALRTTGLTLASLGLMLLVGGLVLLVFLAPGAALLAGAVAAVMLGASAGASAALGVAGALLLALGLLVWTLWFFLRFLLTGQLVAVEPLGARHVIRRADELSSGSIGPGLLGLVKLRLSVLVTVVYPMVLMLSVLASLPEYGAALALSPQPVPVGLALASRLLQAGVASVVVPLYVVFQVLFYVDMLVRREGLDLKLKLD